MSLIVSTLDLLTVQRSSCGKITNSIYFIAERLGYGLVLVAFETFDDHLQK